MSLQLNQDFDYQGDGKWLWSLSLQGSEEELNKIDFVRYSLPSFFPEPTIKSTDIKKNFRVFGETYEPFRVYVKIYFKDESEQNMEYDLMLAKISINNYHQWREPDIFNWWLWIDGDPEEVNAIKKVSYKWIKHGKKKKLSTNDSESGFKISDEGSGSIPVEVDVLFRDGRQFTFTETLQLSARSTNHYEENKDIINKTIDLLASAASLDSVKIEAKPETVATVEELDLNVTQPATSDMAESQQDSFEIIEPASSAQPSQKPLLEPIYERRIQAIGSSESPSPPAEPVVDIKGLLNNELFPSNIEELKKYVSALKGEQRFGLARKLLAAALLKEEWKELSSWINQQLALCTYKDEELPPKSRFAQALAILEKIGLRQPDTIDSETLALGGAIYKRKWQTFGQLEDLHEALFFYQTAYERNTAQDMGYGGVNAAFIMDLLADRLKVIATRSKAQPTESERLQRLSIELRKRMSVEIPMLAKHKASGQEQAQDYWNKQYWYLVTLAEIHFGLGNYEEAQSWLGKAVALNPKEWEKETLFKQLLQIARLQGIDFSKKEDESTVDYQAWLALAEILGENTEYALAAGHGKVGLALSGGGFRASFFHLGLMARLAEIDALRSVEALSTVSGGSILGAHYYLEVQKLLQTKPDSEIDRDDYIKLVERLQQDFLQGVQSNIRMQAFANFRDNLRMLVSKTYTRSHRLGELYESELYRRVPDGKQSANRKMKDLLIKLERWPKDKNPEDFKPKFNNWRRRAKVPVLLLNSTSLNSGHNWQFTASWIGESPGLVGGEVDVNQRYRRLYYKDMPTAELQDYRLGHAVAASACVPGLFDPLSISGLFEGRTVRLVDGGVHDNQGVAGLLDEGCTLILCSDASGQMSDVHNPTEDPAGVLMRATTILQDRVREAEYLDLSSRLDSRALDGLFFVHTQKELEEVPLDWINCKDPLTSVTHSPNNCTSYGIDRDLQKKIAAIRTDLDAFTEVEAYALMASGYRMAKQEFKILQEQHIKSGRQCTWGGYDIDAPGQSWPFSPLEPLLEQAPGANTQRDDLGLQLQVANMTFFKAWGLMPLIKLMTIVLGIIFLIDMSGILLGAWSKTMISVTWGALFIGLATLAISIFAPAFKWLFPKEEAHSFLIKASISLVGYLVAKAQIKWIDPLFLARGKLSRLLKL